MITFNSYYEIYRNKLLEDVIPFWMKYSLDHKCGGFFTCLLEDGKVFDTDKFIWLQARQIWTFAKLYNELDPKQEWLDVAIHGARFLETYGRDDKGSWYFSVTQKGEPLVAPYNIFADCFACMAFGQLYKATGKKLYSDIALQTFHNILSRQATPKGKYEKSISESRSLQNFALPMILCNLTLEIESLLDANLVDNTIAHCVSEIMEQFYQKELGLVLENINSDGSLSDTMDGRLINPGHAIEAMWFLMDIGMRNKDQALIHQAKDISLQMLDFGWDQKSGGIFYFLDRNGFPLQQLEWDQKLWWVHMEALIATLKGYQLTQDEKCLQWFIKIHDYSWEHFNDSNHGEWFGYLKRDGTPLNTMKGGKWKGCFHVPRGLLYCMNILGKSEIFK